MFVFDWQIHAGDLLITAAASLAAVGTRRTVTLLRQHLTRVEQIAEVVDEHSEILAELSPAGRPFPRLR